MRKEGQQGVCVVVQSITGDSSRWFASDELGRLAGFMMKRKLRKEKHEDASVGFLFQWVG